MGRRPGRGWSRSACRSSSGPRCASAIRLAPAAPGGRDRTGKDERAEAMLRRTVKWSLKFRYIVLAIGVGLVYFGVARLREMPIDVFPEFAPPRVEIQTICLGLSSGEVESLVTVPL